MLDCIKECATTYFKNIGWFALAVLVACLVGAGILTAGTGGIGGSVIAACIGFTVAGNAIIAFAACIKFC